MKWTMKLGRVVGIDVYVHATFALLIAYIGFSALPSGLAAALAGIIFVLLVFACVLLHELGHALAARRYGIGTRDIVLLPIGGVARLERMPEDPRQELVVALAGPAVNVVIAAVLYLAGAAAGAFSGFGAAFAASTVFERLLWVNLMLVGFNLIPAFPMDGGRVLRALLAFPRPHAQATAIAARVGKGFAVLFGVYGLITGNLFLVLIAVFIYMAGGAEAAFTRTRSALSGVRASDAALTRYRCLSVGNTLQDAVDETLATAQRDFPVLDAEGRLVGLTIHSDVAASYSAHGPSAPVTGSMRSEFPVSDPDRPLAEALEELQKSGLQSMPLMREGRLVGLLTLENVAEYLTFARSKAGPPPIPRESPARSTFRPPGAPPSPRPSSPGR